MTAFEQALLIQRKLGARAFEGTTLNNIGAAYRTQGRVASALKYFQQALLIQRKLGVRAGEEATLNNIGMVYEVQGRYASALSHFEQALVIQRKLGARAGEGTTLNNIGAVYKDQGGIASALTAFEQALVIRREVGDQAGEGTTLNNIGAVYQAQGCLASALTAFEQTLVIQRKLGARAEEGTTLNNIGGVYLAQGCLASALIAFEQALVIRRQQGDRAGEGTTLNNIGMVTQAQGRLASALTAFEQALVIRREVGERAREGTTLNNIGTIYCAQGHYASSLAAYQQAMDILEIIRATEGSEQGRAAFITQYARLYAVAAYRFHQQGQDEAAFFTSERGRARAFLDSLATGYVELSDNEMADLLTREQEAYAVRLAAQDALARAKALNPPDPTLVADLEAQLGEAEAAHAQIRESIEARGDQLATLIPGRNAVLSLPQVQALLDSQTTLLSYFVLDKQILLFLITRQTFQTLIIDLSDEQLTNRVDYLRNNLVSLRQPTAAQAEAQELYRLLIEPIANSLQTARLAIIPHGPLHYLPFAILQNPKTGQYLIDSYTLLTLPSASSLPFIQQNASSHKSGQPLILGNPATSEPDLDPLPFAQREAQTIAALVGSQALLGAAASKSALRSQASQATLLHLAAHARYNSHNPLYSALYLAADSNHSGRLEVREVYGLDLKNTHLVVLSACETHLGQLSAGDELVGLVRAFFFAGTPTVISTLWRVDDEATCFLMAHFYRYLRAGKSKAEALRQAQLDTMQDYPSPYYWAGFVLSGDGG